MSFRDISKPVLRTKKFQILNNGQRRYIKGLDGLRAIAVIGVLFFHLLPTEVKGGWLGVPLFFVISGYLISDLLIHEFDCSGKIKTLASYGRRLKRLYPALLVMLVVTIIFIFAFKANHDLVYNTRWIFLTNLTYTFNFWEIGHGLSYFDKFGGESPFTHLWSLSIEGQFYLFCPFIVLYLLRKKVNRIKIALGFGIASLISAILMAIFYNPENINRVYYGTDTRLFAILLGVGLSFVWPSTRIRHDISYYKMRKLNALGFASAFVVILAFIFMDGQAKSTYYFGMYLVTICMAILVATIVQPQSKLTHLLDNKVLNYIGTRSYSIYLYQLPVFVFYEKLNPLYRPDLINYICELVIVFVLSEISYNLIENTFRYKLKIKNIHIDMKNKKQILFASLAAVLSLFLIVALANKDAGISKPKSQLQKTLEKNKELLNHNNQDSSKDSKKITSEEQEILDDFSISKADYLKVKNKKITAVGDSLMVATGPYLQQIFKSAEVDADVGRQAYDAPNILAELKKKKELADTVVISLGTNGVITEKDLEKMMKIIGPKREVYWADIFIPKKQWNNSNNSLLNKAKKKYKNFHVFNWSNDVKSNENGFEPDGVHPSMVGSKIWVKDLVSAMVNNKN